MGCGASENSALSLQLSYESKTILIQIIFKRKQISITQDMFSFCYYIFIEYINSYLLSHHSLNHHFLREAFPGLGWFLLVLLYAFIVLSSLVSFQLYIYFSDQLINIWFLHWMVSSMKSVILSAFDNHESFRIWHKTGFLNICERI